jgi:hypothetical protein
MEGDGETKKGKFPRVRLVRDGSVLVASIPGAPEVSVEETNEWIRESREADLADGSQARPEISGSAYS